LKIIVCIKQVPETTDVQINSNNFTLNRSSANGIINPFDLNAIEESVKIKETFEDVFISVLSMGPMSVKSALREALSYGLDSAYLLCDKAFAGSDTFATAYLLSEAIRKIGDFNLILCGKQTIDGETGHVGPELAEILQIPQATNVKKIQINNNEKFAIVESEIEDGYRLLKLKLPALITVNKEINVPRIPDFKTAKKSLKIPITVWGIHDFASLDLNKIGLNGSPTKVVNVKEVQLKKDTQFLHGDIEEIADNFIKILKERHII